MNLFTPERQSNESQLEYQHRRRQARTVVALMRCAGVGNQHKTPSSRQRQRDDRRIAGNGLKGRYGADVIASFQRANMNRMAFLHRLTDEDGMYTLTGARHPITGKRRMWVAGVSAQRAA